jgi:hypothetical protein
MKPTLSQLKPLFEEFKLPMTMVSLRVLEEVYMLRLQVIQLEEKI